MVRSFLRPSRLKLAPRIGFAIMLTVGATFLLDQGLRILIPPPPFLIVQRGWLVESVAAGVEATASGKAVDGGPAQYLDFTRVDRGLPARPSASKLEE